MITQYGAEYSIWIVNPLGARIRSIDRFFTLDIGLAVNDVSSVTLSLPVEHKKYLQPEYRLEIVRSTGLASKLIGQTQWFISEIRTLSQDGAKTLTVSAFSGNVILKRRIVAYRKGNANASASATNADNVMKSVVTNNYGSGAVTARNISSYLGVQANTSQGASVTKEFSNRQVLELLQELAQDSAQQSLPLYFGVVWDATNAKFQFQTQLNQWGVDRRIGTPQEALVSPENGRLGDYEIVESYTDEVTAVYVSGAGDEATWPVEEVTDTTRIDRSPYNRIEAFINNSNTTSSSALQSDGRAFLKANQPKIVFTGEVRDVDGFRFGQHWDWGDRISVYTPELGGAARVEGVGISVNDGVEQIAAHIQSE